MPEDPEIAKNIARIMRARFGPPPQAAPRGSPTSRILSDVFASERKAETEALYRQLYEAARSSGLSNRSWLMQNIRASERSKLDPVWAWRETPTLDELRLLDPEVVHNYLKTIQGIGEEHGLMQTVNDLRQLGTTPGLASYHRAAPFEEGWTLGMNPAYDLGMAREAARGTIERGFHPGRTMFGPGKSMTPFHDVLESIPSHEFGHALHTRLSDWMHENLSLRTGARDPVTGNLTHPELYDKYLDFIDRTAFQNTRLDSAVSGYGRESAERALINKIGYLERTAPAGEDLKAANRIVRQLMFTDNPKNITMEQIKALPQWIRESMTREPIAESLSSVLTPQRILASGEEMRPATARAVKTGGEFMDLVREAEATGAGRFVGAADPLLLLKGAGIGAAALAAPPIINRLVPKNQNEGLNKALKGAVAGAGIGSIIPGIGTLTGAGVGAGLGALASQWNLPLVNQVLGI